jgi:DNA-directed RNA polymerase III subunit RPC1
MLSVAKLCGSWLSHQGFSIGINDVTPSQTLNNKIDEIMLTANEECDGHIQKWKDGTLPLRTGCNLE